MTGYRIRPLDAALDAAAFRCGQPALDDYIRRYASQDVRRGVARVFVAAPDADSHRLAGFFALSAGSVNCSDLPPNLARTLPRYPVPVALLGRLAVDAAFQGRGLGSILLADACGKVAGASAVLAVVGIVVDAKDEPAAAFYRHFGFTPLPGRSERLFLPAKAYSSQRVGMSLLKS
ncbi:GNAT family N-acetyltransferase [Candidatus Thiodictyon syntrophicum]|jgi:GNAT superfamily N-acetyltransferase|uniref:GNAT family N-acetyltransferase n=1 Tax=Candidatus Thiodictyon syntrophicum TaxID=1166950 RepID=A0A2K8U807_9GAMM|nr:GNAT family N-acetyltransferase [Candidatus Thiodictyon syntrophicum]AUB81738.1 GNAT family N-acetyltransferase [Candidatus Thiodictyon syntrophicum]